MTEIKTILRKVKKSYPLLGWRGGDGGFDCWEAEGEIYIAVDTKTKRIEKKTIKKLELIFGSEVEFYDEGYTGTPFITVLLKRGSGEK